jgi:chromosome segregation ATPase
MSDSPSQPAATAELERLRQELNTQTELVQQVRTELIRSQITVLELQDTILQKETDKADAVALLGQAELLLEGKINYIFELDQALNARIAGLQQELATARREHEADRAARDQIAQDLVQKLDQVNRALGDAHTLAGGYAKEAAETGTKLRDSLQATAALREELESWRARADSAQASAQRLQHQLETREAEHRALSRELTTIRGSLAWKLTKPLRALAGPKP